MINLKEQISFSGIDGDEWLRRFYQKCIEGGVLIFGRGAPGESEVADGVL